MIQVPFYEDQLEIPFNCAEVSIQYKYSMPYEQRKVIQKSIDAVSVFRPYFADVMETKEFFYALYLNQAGQVTNISKISEGGYNSTVVDVRLILCIGLQTQAAQIIICHNHPSGNTRPSAADQEITTKIKAAAVWCDIKVIDHIIITANSYLSMADAGYM